MDRQDLRRLARIGAAARLAELERERAALLRDFPELRSGSAQSRRGARGGETAGTPPVRRGRRSMSAAERRAVSLRMKRYWAQRRKTKQSAASKR